MEAKGNEFIVNIREDIKSVGQANFPGLAEADLQKARKGDEGRSVPYKFNDILANMDRRKLDSTTFEAAEKLKELRDFLIHYRPKWLEDGEKEYTGDEYGFEDSLKQEGFALNPLAANGDPFLTTQCMSFGCAEWAARNAEALVRNFEDRIGEDFKISTNLK